MKKSGANHNGRNMDYQKWQNSDFIHNGRNMMPESDVIHNGRNISVCNLYYYWYIIIITYNLITINEDCKKK